MASPSPAILVNSSSPSLPDTTDSAPASPSISRSRSLSPSNSPPPATNLSQPRTPSRPAPPHLLNTTRPSPVVPPSPSQPGSPKIGSRSTSPIRGFRDRDDLFAPGGGGGATTTTAHYRGGLASPARSIHDVPMSQSNSTTDLNHIFERDVEFAASHQITPAEAVDVAIPPVLDEAAVALSSSTSSLSHASLAELVSASSDADHASPTSFPHIPIPRSATSRSFSPDSIGSGGGRGGGAGSSARATSPGSASATSFSVGTPGSSPPDMNPLTRHLSEALEKEQLSGTEGGLTAGMLGPMGGKSGFFSGVNNIPFPSSTTATAGSSIFSPASGQQSPLHPPGSPSLEAGDLNSGASTATTTTQQRRLSFLSYADVINEERLQELTTGNTYERTVSGGSLDLAGVLAALPSSGSMTTTGSSES